MVLLDERGKPAEQAAAVGGSDGAPGRVGGLGTGDGCVCLFDAGPLELCDRLLGGRIEDSEGHRSGFNTIVARSVRAITPAVRRERPSFEGPKPSAGDRYRLQR